MGLKCHEVSAEFLHNFSIFFVLKFPTVPGVFSVIK